MSTVDRYIPLFDEVIHRNPVAIRLNANRCLGLADDNTPLSRQTLIVAIYGWKKRVNATDDEVTMKLSEILDVNTAIENAFVNMGVNMDKAVTEGYAEKRVLKWVHIVSVCLVVLGLIAVMVVLGRLFSNLIFSKVNT